MSQNNQISCLRIATYMAPRLPVEYFETVQQYLEEKLKIRTYLVYETRSEGPTGLKDNPFVHGELDIAFVSNSSYSELVESNGSHAELLPVSSVHAHARGDNVPGYFSDVIVHAESKELVKEMLDLRGCRWAFSSPKSHSGNIIALKTLKLLGENASFFGNILPSGSHINSIRMVADRQADAAAVDANCLALYLDKYPDLKDDLLVLESLGPLPPYPILVRSDLPADLKHKISQALLNMHREPAWAKKLATFKVRQFGANSADTYRQDSDKSKNSRALRIDTVYY
jgi:phosphonate transport system substrate-binding protein